MVNISHFKEEVKGETEIIHIHSYEIQPCPVCGGELRVHGTCHRKVRDGEVIRIYQLRVLKCLKCKHTHRELPEGIVPYKRHSLENICEIVSDPATATQGFCETSTYRRLQVWLYLFLCYARKVTEGLRVKYREILTAPAVAGLKEQLRYFVRVVINSGNWFTASFGGDRP